MDGILFLDFDGVLHPGTLEINFRNVDGRMTPVGDGLFRHVAGLAKALAPYPDLKIVVSSTWRGLFPIPDLQAVLGSLGPRVVDTTGKRVGTRWQDIEGYLLRNPPTQWLAVDDDDEGWPDGFRNRLVCPDANVGLTDQDLEQLGARLEEIFGCEP